MAIFSAFVKSPPVSPSPRSVPNGGLGGFVQFKGKAKTSLKAEGGKSAAERTPATTGATTRTRKEPPPPIRVNSIDSDIAPAQSAPLHQDDNRISPAAVWKISHPPLKTATGVSFVVNEEDDPHTLFSKILFGSNERSKLVRSNDSGRIPGSAVDTATQDIPSPVELPGSLLLPDQGYSPRFKPVLPHSASSRPRSYSDHPLSSSSNRRSRSIVAATKDIDTVKAVLRGERIIKQSRSTTHSRASTAVNTPIHNCSPSLELLMHANINTLSAEDLISIMPMMKAKRLATDWLPAMEKEVGKYKGILHMYSSRTEVHGRHISSICQDLMNLLAAMKKSAGSACKQFEKAQADIDIQKRTDLEKLQHSEEQLQEALLACDPHHDQVDTRAQEYQHLKHVLYHVVATLGGCIRNNLAYKLYHSPEGLSEEVVKILQAYKQWDDHTLKTFPSLVPAELYDSARKEVIELQIQLTKYQQFIDERQIGVLRNQALNNDLTSDADLHNEEITTEYGQFRNLEKENATLRKHISALQTQVMCAGIRSVVEDDPINEIDEDLVTVFSHHSDEIDERDSCIVEQNAVIHDLLKQIHVMSGKHQFEDDHTHTFDQVQLSVGESDLAGVESTTSDPAENKFFGSRRLSRALDPISRSMSSLLSSFEDDSSSRAGQSVPEEQQTRHSHHRLCAFCAPVPTDDELVETNTDSPKSDQKEEDHNNVPLVDVESPKRLETITRQNLEGGQYIGDSVKRFSKTKQRNSTKPYGGALYYRALAQPYVIRRSSHRITDPAYPSIASRLHPHSSKDPHTPGPIRHGKAIMQGLRNEQLPLRLLLDTITMQERDGHQSLSLISESTESPLSIKSVRSPGAAGAEKYGNKHRIIQQGLEWS